MSQYRIGALLGAGGMAEVFAGEAIGTEAFARPVAIKRILPAHARDPQFAALFAAEAQLTSRLRHPNIVETLDFYREADGGLVLVMELVRGVNLSAAMEAGPLPPAAIAFVIAELLRGLGHAHSQQLVHRDVSPHNVLLSWEGAVKVSDFGIAKARDATQATASVLLKGKPAYMSPEQANAQPLDGRSDLFAVGVILWEMLAHRSLFSADDTRATLAAVLFGTVPHPRTYDRKAPPELCRIAMRLLEKERDKRYATADEAISELSKSYPTREEGRRELDAQLADRFLGLVEASPPRPSRRGLMFSLAAALFLGVVGVVVVTSVRTDDPESARPPSASLAPVTPIAVDAIVPPVPYARAAWPAYEPVADIKLPPGTPVACSDNLSLLTHMVRCGRMDAQDRLQFVIARRQFGELINGLLSPQLAEMDRACQESLAVLRGLKLKFFIDCNLSMGEGE